MKNTKAFLALATSLIIVAISSCSKTNEGKPTKSSETKESTISTTKKSSFANVPTNPNNKNSAIDIPADNNYLPAIKKVIQQMNQTGSFSGKCIDNSHNIIQFQENFIGGVIICAGNINIITIVFNPERDKAGHKFQMIAKILASDHQWKLGSISEVEGTDKGLSILMDDELNKGSEKEIISALSTQIVVGTASREGNDRLEKQRAHDRAVEIRRFVNKSYGVRPKYLLNLGRFKEEKCNNKYYRDKSSASKYQRPIIIMNILREPGMPELEQKDIEKSVKKNLDSLGFGLSHQCYSNFDLGL
jgi:hypothetical protein